MIDTPPEIPEEQFAAVGRVVERLYALADQLAELPTLEARREKLMAEIQQARDDLRESQIAAANAFTDRVAPLCVELADTEAALAKLAAAKKQLSELAASVPCHAPEAEIIPTAEPIHEATLTAPEAIVTTQEVENVPC